MKKFERDISPKSNINSLPTLMREKRKEKRKGMKGVICVAEGKNQRGGRTSFFEERNVKDWISDSNIKFQT